MTMEESGNLEGKKSEHKSVFWQLSSFFIFLVYGPSEGENSLWRSFTHEEVIRHLSLDHYFTIYYRQSCLEMFSEHLAQNSSPTEFLHSFLSMNIVTDCDFKPEFVISIKVFVLPPICNTNTQWLCTFVPRGC